MPLDRGIIDQQLYALGEGQRWWAVREFRDLPAVLSPDERIMALSRGKLFRMRWLRRKWLIVVTDRRLLCMRSSASSSWRQLEVGTDHIERVLLRIGPWNARLIVVAPGHTYRLLVSRADGYMLSSTLSSLVPPLHEKRAGFRPVLMARRVIDHVLALPAAAFSPEEVKPQQPAALPPQTTAMQERIASMEDEMEELRRQVRFFEQLMQEQHALPGGAVGGSDPRPS